MTAPAYASMDDAELNEAVCSALGWGGADLSFCEYQSQDNNHADAFLLWFLSEGRAQGRWWNCVTETPVEQRNGEQVYIRKVTLSRELGQPGQVFMAKGESLARAVTVAVLEAHAAKVMKNG